MKTDHGQATAEYVVGVLGAVTIATLLFGPDATLVLRLRELVEDTIGSAFSLTLPELFRWRW